MIELVFVIIVLGILASLAMGRMDRDLKQEAADMVLSHIRLAQQMALNDNKHLPNTPNNWQKGYWQWRYTNCSNGDIYYQVKSDSNLKGGANHQAEAAVDPETGKYIFLPTSYCTNRSKGNNNSPNVALTEKFGVKSVIRTGGCSAGQNLNPPKRGYIAFDYLGRPHHGLTGYSLPNFKNIMHNDCNITFTMSTDQDGDGSDDTFSIIIEEETGYAYIQG